MDSRGREKSHDDSQCSGSFPTLDAKLAAALSKALSNTFPHSGVAIGGNGCVAEKNRKLEKYHRKVGKRKPRHVHICGHAAMPAIVGNHRSQ